MIPFDVDDAAFLRHLSLAIRGWRRSLRSTQYQCPPALAELEAWCSRRLTAGPHGSTVADDLDAVHAALMTPRLLLDKPTAAAALAVSESTVKRLIAHGTLPAVKVAGRTMIRRADLEDYVDNLTETG